MKNSFYHELVIWDDFEEQHHQQIQEILDLVVIDTVLGKLHQDHHHDFLILINESYEDQTILDWLENKIKDIKQLLSDAITSASAEIKDLLSS